LTLPIHALVICCVIYASYLGPILYRNNITNWAVFANNNAFLVGTIVLVVLSSYISTRLRYREYATRFRLAEANEELKKLDIMKSQFFANISHEIRTPLTSIIAPVQSLYQGDAGPVAPVQHELLSQIYRNALRLLDMINQMLDFARFDARKMRLNLSLVDLPGTVHDMATVFREVARQKSLKLECVVDDGIPPVYLDTEKLDRILSNLIRNALKFTEQGEITITVSAGQKNVQIEVADTGIGIPADKLPSIFERFQQVDSSSTRRYEGTGLGLTIVKEAVELQHGTITVQSVPGMITRFIITLPTDLDSRVPDAFIDRRSIDRRNTERRHKREQYAGPERRKNPRRRQDLARVSIEDMAFIDATRPRSPVSRIEKDHGAPEPGYNVLYVEDNADLRAYVEQMLYSCGHTVTTAVDGQDGWNKLQEIQPEIVISDIMMPRLDGYDLLQMIHADPEYRNIPVILTTAKSETDERIRGLEKGADDYLAKPINIRELDARIRNLVTSRMFQAVIAKARELETRMKDLTLAFSRSLEYRDHYTADHSNDVLQFGTIIAEELGIQVDEVFRDSLLLHDIGKLGVPDSILLKEGPLNEEEWQIMKKHAEFGAQLLSDFESFRDVSENILSHQERFDGAGYPRGLSGMDIPLTARIIAVADAWHAMTEDRPYRKALPVRKAVEELRRGQGTHFDPEIVTAFISGLVRTNRIPREIATDSLNL
jgi:response regulator RpfG family c-di-GMP phosphodiesterase/signal transduction histidine kinase